MISKAVGYSGFRTYGELPYPTRKQGKELQLDNKVWESTVRPTDHLNPLQNYHNNKTVYKKSYLQNTFPEHYLPEHVAKGSTKTLQFQNSSSIPAYDKEEAQKYGGQNTDNVDDPRKANLLKTGTEHWRTVYQQSVGNGNQNGGLNGFNGTGSQNNFAINGGNIVGNRGNEPNRGEFGNGTGLGNTGSHLSNTGTNFRSNSVGGKSRTQLAEETARANSYKTKPYINNARTGITDYKFNYGEKIGDSPMNLMNMVSLRQPLRDNPLKRGTNQLWTEVPNYQGFKPSELTFKQYQQRINNRGSVQKGDLKLQTTQNFLVQTPGYGGFKPQFQNTVTQLRESCLGNTKHI